MCRYKLAFRGDNSDSVLYKSTYFTLLYFIPVLRSKKSISRSPGPLKLTHIVRHIFRMPRHTNFKLRIRMDDDNPHQPQAPRPPRSKVKVTRSRDQFEPSWPNVVIRGRWGHTGRPNPAATLLACSHKNIIHNRKQYMCCKVRLLETSQGSNMLAYKLFVSTFYTQPRPKHNTDAQNGKRCKLQSSGLYSKAAAQN